MSAVDNEHFAAWSEYWGELKRLVDPAGETVIYGFENESDTELPDFYDQVPQIGAVYGYVMQGGATVSSEPMFSSKPFVKFTVKAGQWFTFPYGCSFELQEEGVTKMVITQKVGFTGVAAMGGPIEPLGRLKYIDGCSDTLLSCPPLLGDPCFNHLHFPPNIDQTEHTHPSNRSGGIARGSGLCITPYGEVPLVPGLIFHIPFNGKHRFKTGPDDELDVIAYHPDSDWGPTDTEHPMVNRTLVNGSKMDNSVGVHTEAAVIR